MKELLDFVKSQVPVSLQVCEVLSLDESNATLDCRPYDGGADFLEVRLRAVILDHDLGLIQWPAVGSSVVVASLENNPAQGIVLSFSEVDRVSWKWDGQGEVEINAGEVKILSSDLLLGEEQNSEPVVLGDQLNARLEQILDLLKKLFQDLQIFAASGASVAAAPPLSPLAAVFSNLATAAVTGIPQPDLVRAQLGQHLSNNVKIR